MTRQHKLAEQLFSWKTSDNDVLVDGEALWLYGVTLKVPIGPFKAGASLAGVCIEWDEATVMLHESWTTETEARAMEALGWDEDRELTEDDIARLQALAPEMTEKEYDAYRKANTYSLHLSVVPSA